MVNHFVVQRVFRQNLLATISWGPKHKGPISLSHLIPGLKLNQVTT